MTAVETFFKNKKVCSEKLVPFGFSAHGNSYIYLKNIVDKQFQMSVAITKEGKISTKVIDSNSKEEYVLHLVPSAKGPFVGKVREEHEKILTAIAEECFEKEIFKTEDAKNIIKYVRAKYNDELQFLWEKLPDCAIFRRKDNDKWYGLILTAKKNKLGLDGDEKIEIFDMRMEPDELKKIVDNKKYFTGYHMNKKNWFSICLDGSVSVKEIEKYIDTSYELAAKSK